MESETAAAMRAYVRCASVGSTARVGKQRSGELMYRLRGLGTTALAQAIFRQEGVTDAAGNWIPSSLGYRLNNPGNLNYAGQPGATPSGQGNGSEAQFATLDQGIAATEAQLALDASRGLTLSQRLATWATGNPGAYTANVSGWLGVDPNTPIADLLGQNVASIGADTGSVSDSFGSGDGLPSDLSNVALLALGLAAVGIIWAVVS
jgi:hypothetical protein